MEGLLAVCNPVLPCLFLVNRRIAEVELVRDPEARPCHHMEAALGKSPRAYLPVRLPPARPGSRPCHVPWLCRGDLGLRRGCDGVSHPLLNFKLGLTRLAENEDKS